MLREDDAVHYGEWVALDGLTIEYFESAAAVARERGFHNWGTQTNRSEEEWKTRVVFYKSEER